MPQAGFDPPGEKWQLCLNIVVTLPLSHHGWMGGMFIWVQIFGICCNLRLILLKIIRDTCSEKVWEKLFLILECLSRIIDLKYLIMIGQTKIDICFCTYCFDMLVNKFRKLTLFSKNDNKRQAEICSNVKPKNEQTKERKSYNARTDIGPGLWNEICRPDVSFLPQILDEL